MRFEIRRKTYPFSEAPVCDGAAEGYKALLFRDGRFEEISRHGVALDAARAAAAAAHDRPGSGWQACVSGFHAGQRPKGMMKTVQSVSYRVRGN